MVVVSAINLCEMGDEWPNWIERCAVMDELDTSLIAALRRDGRASLSDLAADLGVTRATVRARMARLMQSGEIAGFTVQTYRDVAPSPVRGLMMLGIEGRGADRITRTLQGMVAVTAVHSTNGAWDLVVEIGTDTLEALDKVLFDIRRIDGVTRSETNLLLSTRRAGRGR